MDKCVLVCDDEKDIVAFIKDSLTDDGYRVITAFNGEEAIAKAAENPDIIILDIMMPYKDGFEVCKAIREMVSCPIIFLSARENEIDKVKGFAIGGDDYMVKPFSVRELKARIAAHIRRDSRNVQSNKHKRLSFKNLIIDINERAVYCEGKTINFTKREFDIIELLALNKGQVFSREQIYEAIWGYDGEGDSSCVSEHVKNLRNKLESVSPEEEYIKTVWGIGYKWERCN